MSPTLAIREPLAVLRAELSPYPGRVAAAARISICCMLTTVACMALEAPEAALSCYLIFFAAKDDAQGSIAMALELIFGAALGIALGATFLMISADEPMLRLLMVMIFTFVGMFLAQASRLGPIGSVAGFVLAAAMTMFDVVPIPELLVRGLFYMWQAVAIPMVVLIIVSFIAAPRVSALMRRAVVDCAETAAALLEGRASARIFARDLLGQEAAKMRERRKTAFLFFPGGARERKRIRGARRCELRDARRGFYARGRRPKPGARSAP